MALNLVTDRTAADVAAKNAKGCYNYTDLNRVESAVAELMGRLNANGSALALVTKTDWHTPTSTPAAQDTPTMAEMQRYRDNIAAIRGELTLWEDTPDAPISMRYLNYTTANEIEELLLAIESALDKLEAVFSYSNELYSGESAGWIAEG